MDNSVLRVSYQSILQQGKKLTLYRPDGTSQVLKSANPDKDYGEYWEQLIFIGTVPDSAINEIESIVIPPERQELFSPKEKKVNYRNCIHLSLIAADELGRSELAKAKANARQHEARRRKIEDDELINGFSELSINLGFEYTVYIKTMEVLDGILPSSPIPADPATPSQLQESEQHDDEYYLSIQDHHKRRLQMRNDGIIPSEISRWEKQQNNDGKFKTSPPSTGIAAIKQDIQRTKKSNTK